MQVKKNTKKTKDYRFNDEEKKQKQKVDNKYDPLRKNKKYYIHEYSN